MIRIWDIRSRTQLGSINTQTTPSALAWHPTEPWVVAAIEDSVSIWDTNANSRLTTLRNQGLRLRSICFNPQGDRLAVAGGSTAAQTVAADSPDAMAAIRVWDLEKRAELRTLRGHGMAVNSVNWDRSGERIVSGSDDGTIRVWNVDTGHELLSLSLDDLSGISYACFSPDELQIAAVAQNGTLIWDASSGYAMELSPRLLPVLDRRIAQSRRSEDMLLRARINARLGNWDQAASDFDQAAAQRTQQANWKAWFSTRWVALGPFPDEPTDNLPRQVEQVFRKPVLNDQSEWEAVSLDRGHYFNFAHYLHQAQRISSIVATRIYSTSDQSVGCLLGATGRVKVFCNGQLLYSRQQPRPVTKDDQAVDLQLNTGWNTVAIQITPDESQHGLFVRLTDDHEDLARHFGRSGEWSSALEHWTLVVEKDPREAFVFEQGKSALNANQPKLAEKAFDAFIAMSDDKLASRRKVAREFAMHGLTITKRGGASSFPQPDRDKTLKASLATARRLYEQLFEEEEPWNEEQYKKYDTVAGDLADVVYYHEDSPRWLALEAIQASAGGARLRIMDDHSILADGVNPTGDRYTIVAETSVDRIVAIKIDPMADRSMVFGNVGRCLSVGDYKLSEFRLTVEHPDGNVQTIDFQKAYRAYRTSNGFQSAELIIDGNPATQFSTTDDRDIILIPEQPIRNAGRIRVTAVLQFAYGRHALGRFRLFTTNDPQLITPFKNRHEIIIHDNAFIRLGIAYAFSGEPKSAAKAFARALDRAQQTEEVTEIIARAKAWEGVFEELKTLRPGHSAFSS